VNVRRVITWLVVALVLLYVIDSPEHAAQLVSNAGGGLSTAASSLLSFLGSLD
jgi:hypothetical protein